MNLLFSVLEAAVLAAALSADAFLAAFAYGSNKIRIPMSSIQIINLVCSSILGVSLFVGSLVRPYIPHWLTVVICFSVLFLLGMVKLLDGVTKSIIRKYNHMKKEIRFTLFNFRFVLNLYADPVEADLDHSKTISPSEAVSLAVALSLDGLAVGFGAAVGALNPWAIFFASLLTGTLALLLGVHIGNKVANKLPFNLSWLSGAILIGLAFTKLF